MYNSQITGEALRKLSQRKSDALDTAKQRRFELYNAAPRLGEIATRLSSLGAEVGRLALSGSGDKSARLKEMANLSVSLQNERKEILLRMGLEEDYLEPPHTCKECSDSGYVQGRRCACLTALLKAEACKQLPAPEHLQEYCFDTFSLEYYPEHITVDGVGLREHMKSVLHKCRGFADAFPSHGESLLFYGGTGLGKTHLSLAIAQQVAGQGVGVAYASSQQLVDRAERAKFGRDQDGSDDIFVQTALKCDLLVLDDLGSEFSTQLSVATIFHVINTRQLEHRPTIISSNLSPEQMQERYSQRLVSRILCGYSVIPFVGQDVRMQKSMAD